MAKGGFPKGRGGFGGGKSELLRQVQMQQKIMKMQEEMAKTQEVVESQTFTASVGGGAVKATANGKKELTELVIDKELLNPEDVETLQDMIVSAANEALRQAEDAMNKSMEGLAGGFNIPGFKL